MFLLSASVLIFRWAQSGQLLEGAAEIGHVLVADHVRDLVYLIPAVAQQLQRHVYPVSGQIADDGVVRLLLEHMAEVSLADAEMLGDLGYAYAAVGVVLGDVFERLQHVAAFVALFERERVDNAQLALLLLLLPDALDGEDKLVILKGLEQIVVRVELERGAGVLKVAVRREYDDVRAAAAAASLCRPASAYVCRL